MAATDTVLVRKVYPDAVNGSTNGVAETVNLADFLTLLPTATVAGATTTVIAQTAPAAAAVPFADLTAAANSFNALRTALIAAKVLI